MAVETDGSAKVFCFETNCPTIRVGRLLGAFYVTSPASTGVVPFAAEIIGSMTEVGG